MENISNPAHDLDLLQKSERAAELHPFLDFGPLWYAPFYGCGLALVIAEYDSSFPINIIGLLLVFIPSFHAIKTKNIKVKFPTKLQKTQLLFFLGIVAIYCAAAISWAMIWNSTKPTNTLLWTLTGCAYLSVCFLVIRQLLTIVAKRFEAER